MSTKLELLGNLVNKVDVLIIGGGMANTFLFAEGKGVGKSLCEKDLADTARSIAAAAKKAKCRILLPVDATVAKELKAHAPAHVVGVDHVPEDEMILDIGPKSIAAVEKVLSEIKTLVWNGPFGAFETPPFDKATMAIAKTAARLTKEGKLTSVAGGGDTVAALNDAKVADDFTYVSTAGGAFLEWMEGKALPGRRSAQAEVNSARPYSEALRRPPDQAPLIVEGGFGQSAAIAAEQASRLEADPFSFRSAEEIDGQIAVDEDIFGEIQRGADPVAESPATAAR